MDEKAEGMDINLRLNQVNWSLGYWLIFWQLVLAAR